MWLVFYHLTSQFNNLKNTSIRKDAIDYNAILYLHYIINSTVFVWPEEKFSSVYVTRINQKVAYSWFSLMDEGCQGCNISKWFSYHYSIKNLFKIITLQILCFIMIIDFKKIVRHFPIETTYTLGCFKKYKTFHLVLSKSIIPNSHKFVLLHIRFF